MRGKHVVRKGGWDCHGLPGRGAGREGARLLGQARDRGLRHRALQRQVPVVGAALRRGLAVAHRAASACGSTPRARTGRSRTSTSRACGGCSTRCGTRARSTRATRSSPTAAAAAPRCRATSSASPARTATSPSRRSTCASRSSTATSTSSCGRPRRGRCRRTSAPRSARTFDYVRVRAPEGGRDLVLARDRVAAVLGADAEVVGDGRRRRPRRRALRAAVHAASPVEGDAFRVVADDFVTVDDGSGIVHLAPAFGEIDREVGEREGLPDRQPGQRRGALHRRRRRAVRGPVREGRRSRRSSTTLAARGQARRGRRLHALATRTAGAATRRSSTGPSPRGSRARRRIKDALLARERDDQLAPRAHQARPLRRLAREQRRLGALPRPLLGHADPGVALRRLRARHVHRFGRRARRSSPTATSPAWTCTARTSTTSRSAARSASTAPRTRIEPVLDAWFDSGSMPDRAVPLPVRERRRVRRAASPPTSSARRSTRPAAGSTRCSR